MYPPSLFLSLCVSFPLFASFRCLCSFGGDHPLKPAQVLSRCFIAASVLVLAACSNFHRHPPSVLDCFLSPIVDSPSISLYLVASPYHVVSVLPSPPSLLLSSRLFRMLYSRRGFGYDRVRGPSLSKRYLHENVSCASDRQACVHFLSCRPSRPHLIQCRRNQLLIVHL